MITREEFEFLKNKIYKRFSFDCGVDFKLREKDGVYISFDGKNAEICGTVKTNTMRALTLLIKNIREGKENFVISEKKHFDSLGFMLDVSRNAVMKVSKIKELIDTTAALGFDSFMLYMEDTFKMEKYPYFGYRRGAYSYEELKELDDYAEKLGMEIVPSIQTLGHLEQYLRYTENDSFRENEAVLLCGEEKTYEFIDETLKTMRKAFRAKRINIGCDEAKGVGLGNYLKKHSYTERSEIIKNHLKKVTELCRKYDFEPLVCGDLYIPYYDFNYEPDENFGSDVPDVDILYWDYYHTEKEDYEKFYDIHLKLKRPVTFYGGIWTWCGLLPNPEFTYTTMNPALTVMLEKGVKNVWAATYGDDGNETNMFMAVPSLPVFSEKCFKGKKCRKEDIYGMTTHITGIEAEKFMAMSENHFPFIEYIPKEEYIWPNYMGKKIFYSDILYNFTNTYDFEKIKEHNLKGYEAIKDCGKCTKWELHFEFAKLVFKICLKKIDVMCDIRARYEKKDTQLLKSIAENDIPYLLSKYEKINIVWEKLWLSTNKVFGWEELNGRIGAIRERLQYAKRRIESYVAGEAECIEELDYDFIEDINGSNYVERGVCFYKRIKSTSI